MENEEKDGRKAVSDQLSAVSFAYKSEPQRTLRDFNQRNSARKKEGSRRGTLSLTLILAEDCHKSNSVKICGISICENLRENRKEVSRRLGDRKTARPQDYLDFNTATNPPFLAKVILINSPDLIDFSDFLISVGSLSDFPVSAHISIV
jgi:hypothetical protein